MVSRSSAVRRICRALVLCAALGPFSARAAPDEPTLRDAIAAALADNPDLRSFDFELRAAAAQRGQAMLRPAPQIGLELENFAGTGATKGFDEVEATLSLSQVVELGGKRDARVAVADAGRDGLAVARQAAQLDVLAEVTRRFIAVVEGQEKVRLAQRATDLARQTVHGAETRVRAAKAPHVEFDRATVALERAQLEQRSAASRLDAARRFLAATWGADDATIDGRPIGTVRGELFSLPQPGDFPSLMARLEKSPDFLRFASDERLKDAELRLAATQRRGDFTVGAGVRRLEGPGDTALVASFSIPLFAGRRAESFVAEAAARRDAVGSERQAALVKARAQLYALHRQLQDAIGVVESLDSKTAPRMEEALRETEYAFRRGRYGYLELVDAQREYLAVQGERIEAGAQAQLLAAEIERLSNAPLTP